MIQLLCPAGAEDGAISHGHHNLTPYRRADGRWAVDVPRHAAGPLVKVGGFSIATEPAPPVVSGEMRRVDRIDGNTTDGAAGCKPDADGTVLVPVELVGDLLAHGYYPVEHCRQVRAERRRQLDDALRPLLAERAAIDRVNARGTTA
jgi:hypothetical protein